MSNNEDFMNMEDDFQSDENFRIRLKYLVQTYLQQQASKDEELELFEYISLSKTNDEKQTALFEEMAIIWQQTNNQIIHFDQLKSNSLYNYIQQEAGLGFKPKQAILKPIWRSLIAVAAVFILILGGYWIYNSQLFNTTSQTPMVAQADIQAPSSNKAVIQLANGQTVMLDSASTGTIGMEGAVGIIKNPDGTITYAPAQNNGQTQQEVYNKITNPRGSQVVTLVLSDGTKVWLNAASTLEYPIAFLGNKRSLKMTGEVYFEVAHNPSAPCTVFVNDALVQVLGTSFNINAHKASSNTMVTLINGSVKLSANNLTSMLKPGQQGNIGETIQINNQVDIDAVLAWKQGIFSFNSISFKDMMEEIGRWYDIDILYPQGVPERSFGGKLHRNVPLTEVLQVLKESDVKFRLNGKQLTIQP